MTITLRPEQERRIAAAVRSGAYRSPDEVIDRALEMLQEQEEWLIENRTAIGQQIEEGSLRLNAVNWSTETGCAPIWRRRNAHGSMIAGDEWISTHGGGSGRLVRK